MWVFIKCVQNKRILKVSCERWEQQPFDFKWQSFDRPLAFTGFEL